MNSNTSQLACVVIGQPILKRSGVLVLSAMLAICSAEPVGAPATVAAETPTTDSSDAVPQTAAESSPVAAKESRAETPATDLLDSSDAVPQTAAEPSPVAAKESHKAAKARRKAARKRSQLMEQAVRDRAKAVALAMKEREQADKARSKEAEEPQ